MKLHVAMSLRMQLRRIVIMMITEYPVPSLARNYPCKEYQIMYESVHIYLCTCRRNKYPCKSAFVWNVHIQVMLKLISFSILNIGQFTTLTICPDINELQIPLKTSCTGHRWRKAKDFFVFCSRKICLVLFQGCCSFVLRHLCPVHKINAQSPITTILATHQYYKNWSWMQSTEWTDLIGNPISACRLISGNNILLMEYI